MFLIDFLQLLDLGFDEEFHWDADTNPVIRLLKSIAALTTIHPSLGTAHYDLRTLFILCSVSIIFVTTVIIIVGYDASRGIFDKVNLIITLRVKLWACAVMVSFL